MCNPVIRMIMTQFRLSGRGFDFSHANVYLRPLVIEKPETLAEPELEYSLDPKLEKRPRRVLIVSYWYPPAVGAAAERVFGFARYLPEHGWEPYVLTAKRSRSADNAPGISVIEVADPHAPSGAPFSDYDPRQRPSRWKSFLREFIFPDRFAKWQRTAYRTVIHEVRSSRFDLILASFPPASVVQLAARLQRATQTPLVLDYRDRWFGPGGYEPRRRKAVTAHKKLESEAVSNAAAIIAVSDAMASAIAEEQGIDRDRIFVLPNGYDSDAPSFPGTAGEFTKEYPGAANPSPITIAHVGTVIPRNRPDLFFESVRRFKSNPHVRNVVFKFVGNLSRAYVDAVGLSSVVSTTGLIPREEARRAMQNADALLLLTGAYVGRWGHNAKVFEYLQSARPILCLEEEPGSNDRKLLQRFAQDRVFFAPVNDADAIVEQIERIRKYLACSPTPHVNSAFQEYGRANLTARLAHYLDSLI